MQGPDRARIAGTTEPYSAFTLIELLVVIAIISLLMSMLMPSMAMIRRMARQSQTQAILGKVDGALRLFRSDWGVYPAQASYPTMGGTQAYSNRLAYHLGTDLAPADQLKIVADADRAAAKFNFVYSGSQPSAVTYDGWMIPDGNGAPQKNHAALLNRMAMERASSAVIAGITDQRGPVVIAGDGSVISDQRSTRVLTASEATSAGNPGWAADYLSDGIAPEFIDGEQVLDAYRRPLIYIGRVVPGVQGVPARVRGAVTNISDHKRFGLGHEGFDPTTGPGPDLAASRPRLLSSGRVRLSREDAGDGAPTPAHPVFFPDPDDLMRSDLRYYAAPGFEAEFELWSAGRSGRFDYMRDHADNDDNVAAGPYLRGLTK